MLHVPVVLFTDRMVSNCLIHLSMSQGTVLLMSQGDGSFDTLVLVCQGNQDTLGAPGVSKEPSPWLTPGLFLAIHQSPLP